MAHLTPYPQAHADGGSRRARALDATCNVAVVTYSNATRNVAVVTYSNATRNVVVATYSNATRNVVVATSSNAAECSRKHTTGT